MRYEQSLLWQRMAVNGTDHEQDILVTMSRTGSLYANKRLLAKNCTSFDITPAHIIFTTTQHLIKFVHITSVEGDRLLPLNTELQN